MIQIKSRRSAGTKNGRLTFDPRQIFTLEAAGIATIILSAAVMAGVLYSIW